MPRKMVLTKVPVALHSVANDFLVDLFGDDPGSQEINLNAYILGGDSAVATHSLGCMNVSQADASTIATWMSGHSGCASAEYPMSYTPPSGWWGEAGTLWDMYPVVPVTP